MARRHRDEEEITLSGLPFGLTLFGVWYNPPSTSIPPTPTPTFYLLQLNGDKLLQLNNDRILRNG